MRAFLGNILSTWETFTFNVLPSRMKALPDSHKTVNVAKSRAKQMDTLYVSMASLSRILNLWNKEVNKLYVLNEKG